MNTPLVLLAARLWRLFDTDETDPDKLPANGSLRRCYIAHLKNGGTVGWGYGVRI